MGSKVSLDALIGREDFDVEESEKFAGAAQKDTVSITDLRSGEFFMSSLRKPDFQRETNEWDAEKVCDFIESFLDEDLIPAVILWRSKGSYTFVIDGSHRISALSAWINDDYGDGVISRKFYDGNIPEDQQKIANKTREFVRKRVSTYLDYTRASADHSLAVDSILLARVRRLGTIGIKLQWVQGDSKKAEQSFFKINQKASPIDATELRIIRARRKPNGIAARAIIRSATGHKYWSCFNSKRQEEISELAREVYKLMFDPYLDSPIKTLDIPIGGKAYSAQAPSLVLDFANICNQIMIPSAELSLVEDSDGTATVKFLSATKDVLDLINSSHPGSLGLHPIVYFYSATGRHKPASLLAIAAFVQEIRNRNQLKAFISVRSKFEELLIKYDFLIQQIVRNKRSAIDSYQPIKVFLLFCVDYLYKDVANSTVDECVKAAAKISDFSYLLIQPPVINSSAIDFSKNVKSQAFIRDAIKGARCCSICGGYLHKNSISIDHMVRRADGGLGTVENAQLSHPFCNTGIKN